jgi:chromosomal replication initiator protein
MGVAVMTAVDMATETQLQWQLERKARLARMGSLGPVPSERKPLVIKVPVQPKPVRPTDLGGLHADPKFTLENFSVVDVNKVAHAAVFQVAHRDGGQPTQFNPLVIHGRSGVGKTHLLHAAANALGSRAVLLSAERFYSLASNEAGKGHLRNEMLRFDTVLIDDIQLLSGKTAQAELQYFIQRLCDRWRQVVLAGNEPVRDIPAFTDRLIDRLTSGLELDIGVQGFELRRGIVETKAEAQTKQCFAFYLRPELSDQVARLASNGREIDAIINKLAATTILGGQEINEEVVSQAASEVISPAEPKRIKIEDIQRVTARYYSVSRSDLLSSRRTANIVKPRQVAMYLCKTLTLRSLPEIGRRFGGRDHTTVLHAVRKFESYVQRDVAIRDEVDAIKFQLSEI